MLMADDGVACSMGHSGNVWGDAGLKSFLSSLKIGRAVCKVYHTQSVPRRHS